MKYSRPLGKIHYEKKHSKKYYVWFYICGPFVCGNITPHFSHFQRKPFTLFLFSAIRRTSFKATVVFHCFVRQSRCPRYWFSPIATPREPFSHNTSWDLLKLVRLAHIFFPPLIHDGGQKPLFRPAPIMRNAEQRNAKENRNKDSQKRLTIRYRLFFHSTHIQRRPTFHHKLAT